MADEDYLVRSFEESSCQTVITQFDLVFLLILLKKEYSIPGTNTFQGTEGVRQTGVTAFGYVLLHSVVPFV